MPVVGISAMKLQPLHSRHGLPTVPRARLHEDVALDEHLQPELLPLDQDGRSVPAADPLVLPVDPRVDPRSDVGIDAVDSDGDVLDVVFCQLVHAVGQGQAVRRDAQLDVGRLLRQHAKGGEGPFRVGQRIARTGDAQDGHLRDVGRDRPGLFHGLLRRQDLRDDPGPRLVGAVVFAVAVVTLNVAGGGDGDVHAGEVMVGLLGIAGVIEHPVADRFGEVTELVRRAATGTRCTSPLRFNRFAAVQ
jgi:hypothetical protein